jgi:hypothetical protein
VQYVSVPCRDEQRRIAIGLRRTPRSAPLTQNVRRNHGGTAVMTKGTRLDMIFSVKPFRWNPDKNERLKAGRGISFEEIVAAVEEDGLKDVLVHPNQRRYPGQVVLVVAYRDYIFLVPSVEEKTHYFLKTIIPSRKATRDYLGTGETDEEA